MDVRQKMRITMICIIASRCTLTGLGFPMRGGKNPAPLRSGLVDSRLVGPLLTDL